MVTFSLTSPPRSFFHHFASQSFQARTLEKKKKKKPSTRCTHVSKRNSRVFRRPEDSRSVNFPVKKLVSSILPSPRPEITRVDRSAAKAEERKIDFSRKMNGGSHENGQHLWEFVTFHDESSGRGMKEGKKKKKNIWIFHR